MKENSNPKMQLQLMILYTYSPNLPPDTPTPYKSALMNRDQRSVIIINNLKLPGRYIALPYIKNIYKNKLESMTLSEKPHVRNINQTGNETNSNAITLILCDSPSKLPVGNAL
jgi:hypothetical protein